MKMPIRFHTECYQNRKRSLMIEEDQLRSKIDSVERSRNELAFYEKQIRTAKAAGRVGFDREKYLLEKEVTE